MSGNRKQHDSRPDPSTSRGNDGQHRANDPNQRDTRQLTAMMETSNLNEASIAAHAGPPSMTSNQQYQQPPNPVWRPQQFPAPTRSTYQSDLRHQQPLSGPREPPPQSAPPPPPYPAAQRNQQPLPGPREPPKQSAPPPPPYPPAQQYQRPSSGPQAPLPRSTQPLGPVDPSHRLGRPSMEDMLHGQGFVQQGVAAAQPQASQSAYGSTQPDTGRAQAHAPVSSEMLLGSTLQARQMTPKQIDRMTAIKEKNNKAPWTKVADEVGGDITWRDCMNQWRGMRRHAKKEEKEGEEEEGEKEEGEEGKGKEGKGKESKKKRGPDTEDKEDRGGQPRQRQRR